MTAFEELFAGPSNAVPEFDAQRIRDALRSLDGSVRAGLFPAKLGRDEVRVMAYLVGYAVGIAASSQHVGTRH